jgi:hypothetical protein
MANEKSSHYHVVHEVFAAVATFILIKIVDAIVGLRVDIEDESTGLFLLANWSVPRASIIWPTAQLVPLVRPPRQSDLWPSVFRVEPLGLP